MNNKFDTLHLLKESPATSGDDTEVLVGRPPNASKPGALPFDTVCLVCLTTLASLYMLYAAAAVIFPIVLAGLVAAPLLAPVAWLERCGVPRCAGAAFVVGSVLVFVGAAATKTAEPATMWIKDAPENLRDVERKLRAMGGGAWKEVEEASAEVEQLTAGAEDQSTLKVEVKQPSWTSKALNATSEFAVGAVICVSLVYLLLAFGDKLVDSIVCLCSPGFEQRNMRTMFDRIEKMVSQYLLTYTGINLTLGTAIGLGLWCIGMPNPILWGVMAACLNYIPFAGLAIGSLVVTLVALLTFDSVLYAALAPTIYLVANGLEANILTPALLGRSLRLNIIMIFVFIVLWGWIWGIGGALIAVPLLATIRIVCDHFESLAPLGRLLSA